LQQVTVAMGKPYGLKGQIYRGFSFIRKIGLLVQSRGVDCLEFAGNGKPR